MWRIFQIYSVAFSCKHKLVPQIGHVQVYVICVLLFLLYSLFVYTQNISFFVYLIILQITVTQIRLFGKFYYAFRVHNFISYVSIVISKLQAL